MKSLATEISVGLQYQQAIVVESLFREKVVQSAFATCWESHSDNNTKEPAI